MLALIMAIKDDNEREKVADIYKLYSGTMLYIANGILNDIHLAEDAVSEAFMKIIDNLEKINTVDCYQTRGFVVIIVRNVSLDLLRRQNRSKLVPFDITRAIMKEVISFLHMREQQIRRRLLAILFMCIICISCVSIVLTVT